MKNKLTVELGDRSYPIYIESGLLTNADKWIDTIKKRGKVVIITNTTVQQWYLQPLKDSLVKYGISPLALILEDGEKYKNYTLNKHCRQCKLPAIAHTHTYAIDKKGV